MVQIYKNNYEFLIHLHYCHKNKFHFKLSTNELFFQNSDASLHSLLHEAEDLDGILMCSIYMLPHEKKTRDLIFKKLINQNCQLHFILENIVIKKHQDIIFVNDILQLKKFIKGSPSINIVKESIINT